MKKFHVVFKTDIIPQAIGENCEAKTVADAIFHFYHNRLVEKGLIDKGLEIIAVYSLDDINDLLAHQKTEFNTSTAKPEGEEDRNEANRLDSLDEYPGIRY